MEVKLANLPVAENIENNRLYGVARLLDSPERLQWLPEVFVQFTMDVVRLPRHALLLGGVRLLAGNT